MYIFRIMGNNCRDLSYNNNYTNICHIEIKEED